MDLELRHMRAFVAVADAQNYTRAAQTLRVSQPALTRTIQQLERLVQTELIARTSRSFALTDRGVEFLGHARRILADVDAVTTHLSRATALRVGFAWLLPDWFTEVITRYESTDAHRVDLVRTDDPVAALIKGDLDVAVTRRRVDDTGFTARPIAVERRVVVVAATSELARLPDLTWQDLADEPLIVNVLSGTTTPESWPDAPADRTIVYCNNFDEWIELTAAGRGVSAAPAVVRTRVRHPGVVYRDVPGTPDSTMYLAWKTGSVHRRAVERFASLTVDTVRTDTATAAAKTAIG